MNNDDLRALIEGAVSTDDAATAEMLAAVRKMAMCVAEAYLTMVEHGTPEDVARHVATEIMMQPFRRST